MKDIQQVIQSLLDQLVAEKRELGIQVAAYIDGNLAIDAYAGIADRATNQAVDGDTLFPVFSTTKGIAATVLHILAERGMVDYETPIAAYWPEFAARGKGGITLRHGLNHTAGLPNMPTELTHADLCDWKTMCAKIADLTPVSAPGVAMVYHAMTYGWIVGEVACRVTGRTFPQLIQEEICAPLGITNLFVSIPDKVEPRVAILEADTEEPDPPPDTAPQSVPALVRPLYKWMNHPAARRACIPGSNGIMNARSIARHYAALLPGGVDGVELLPPGRVSVATEPQHPSGDPKDQQSRGLGYALGEPNSLLGERRATFGHVGYGNSVGFADPEKRVAFALTRNRFGNENTPQLIVDKFREALS